MKDLTLVLNADDVPLNVASQVRAFNLVFKGKAIVVAHDEDNPFVSESETFKRPTIIRLINWIYVPHRKQMPLTRLNIYKRVITNTTLYVQFSILLQKLLKNFHP